MRLFPWLLSALVLIAQAGLMWHDLRHALTVAEAAVWSALPDGAEDEDVDTLCEQCLAAASLQSLLVDGTGAAPVHRHASLHGGQQKARRLGAVGRWHQARDPPAT